MRELELNHKGVLFCVSGPSGVGKGTVISAVRAIKPQLCHSVSITTRKPRVGEQEGIDYYFRSQEAFLRMIQSGSILEYDEYCGNYYGTPRQPIEDKLNVGIDIIMDVTVPGSLETLKNFPEAVSIFILPPSIGELQKRLTKRGTEPDSVIQKRMEQSLQEMRLASHFDYVVVNHDIQVTAQRLLAIMDAEKQRYKRMAGIEEIILNR